MEKHLKQQLEQLALEMRKDALLMAYHAGAQASHFGGGVSIIDILAVLYGGVMKLDRMNPEWEDRDRFILSKGHGVLGYYAALAQVGYITHDDLLTFEKSGSFLLGHPVKNRKKGIEFTTGSLGMGLSLGIGVALAMKKREEDKEKSSNRVYVLMGDGECNEGSVWEGFMSAAQFKLNNLTAIIDRNGYQLGGETKTVMDVGDIADKLRAFGWQVTEVDGHSIESVYEALKSNEANQEVSMEEKPRAVIAHTVKGKGFSFAENDNAWHHAVLTKEQYEKAKKELDDRGAKAV